MEIKEKIIKIILRFIDNDTLRIELSRRDFGIVEGSIFNWMDSWIKAFEIQNKEHEGISEKIKEWIHNQPMCGS